MRCSREPSYLFYYSVILTMNACGSFENQILSLICFAIRAVIIRDVLMVLMSHALKIWLTIHKNNRGEKIDVTANIK